MTISGPHHVRAAPQGELAILSVNQNNFIQATTAAPVQSRIKAITPGESNSARVPQRSLAVRFWCAAPHAIAATALRRTSQLMILKGCVLVGPVSHVP